IGLGYTLFGSKAFGTDYSFAFANAEVSVVNSEEGAEIEFAANGGDKAAIKARFEQDGMDAMNAAKCGYIDDVIEPQYVRSYVISALQMLIRG
ncbi:MAG: methylmalonyl-CoA carboxyltransferase, partial [Clostridia bacterium]|nr:methylmalonyl-CoA carboxyltransferase [Clostridia bacterium]